MVQRVQRAIVADRETGEGAEVKDGRLVTEMGPTQESAFDGLRLEMRAIRIGLELIIGTDLIALAAQE